MKKVLVSGIQSSGQLHIGNYFGAIKQIIDLVNTGKYEAYVFVADYHSMTTLTNGKERIKNTFDIVATYLACGIDKNKVNIFKQSDILYHTELSWILNTITPIPMLFLAHSFKDKSGQNKNEKFNLNNLKNINAGLFDYPVLMAADILIYGGDIIPVGKDQEQHIEYAREIAKKYNETYNTKRFKMPQAFIQKEIATIIGIDGNKMSKSKNNIIPLFADEEEIKKRVSLIKTDSLKPEDKKNPDENNIYKIHKLFLNKEEDKILREKFLNSDKIPYSYKNAKEDLANTIIKYFENMKKEYLRLTTTKDGKEEVFSIMKVGAENANKRANDMMNKIKKETGLNF